VTLAARAQAVVDGQHHAAQLVRRVRGDQVDAVLGRRLAHERLERAVERRVLEARGVGLGQHLVLGVEPGGQGVRPQQPSAEAVDGRDERGLGRARVLALAAREERRAQPALELGRRLLGERDGQDALDRDVVVAHRAHEPLDQHARLAAARARAQEQGAVAALDGLALLVGEVERRHFFFASLRQIEG
jgi:hypothetical protein